MAAKDLTPFQFKPGQSGNAKGRPKGSLNLATALHRELKQRVVINEGGRRKTVTKLEAVTKQTVNKAAGGDARAQNLLYTLIPLAEENHDKNRAQQKPMTASDQKVLEGILQRLNRGFKEVS